MLDDHGLDGSGPISSKPLGFDRVEHDRGLTITNDATGDRGNQGFREAGSGDGTHQAFRWIGCVELLGGG